MRSDFLTIRIQPPLETFIERIHASACSKVGGGLRLTKVTSPVALVKTKKKEGWEIVHERGIYII